MSKIWFVTGASSGFGEALTGAILQRGDRVAATFRSKAQADAFTQKASPNGLGLVLDVTDAAGITTAVQQAVDAFGTLDVVVNNAGYGTVGALEEFSMDEIRAQMETNFFGAVAVTKEALPLLRKKGSGHIVQLSSGAGFKATGGFGLYNASKFALEGFSEALAQEVAPFGIKVTLVEPGPFRTKFAGSSVKLAARRMEAYSKTPVAQMYQYISRVDGTQEGDTTKGAQAIVDYVYSNSTALRLPLGKAALQSLKAKLASVQADLTANESIALRTMIDK